MLRAAAARDAADPQPTLTLAQFLLEVRGAEAARAELQARIAAATAAAAATADTTAAGDPRPFQRALAGLDFSQGRKDQGIAALRQLLEGAVASDGTRDLQVALAEMLAETGALAESGTLIATVLAGDPNNVEALKLHARLAIDADQPDQAVQDMRLAQAQAPNDAETMTIMALAHERAGSRALAGEQLARAVEVSGQGRSRRACAMPASSGRTSGSARPRGWWPTRCGAPRTTAGSWLEARPGSIWRARTGPAPRRWRRCCASRRVRRPRRWRRAWRPRALRGQGRAADAAAALEGLAGPDGGNVRAMADSVQGYAGRRRSRPRRSATSTGCWPRIPAERRPAGCSAPAPRPARRAIPAAAEAGYRAVVADGPCPATRRIRRSSGFLAEPRTAPPRRRPRSTPGSPQHPRAPRCASPRPGCSKSRATSTGAIAAYEALYAEDSGSPVLANNLASLLASYRDDPARAWSAPSPSPGGCAGSEVPLLPGHLGLDLQRRGDSDQALNALAPAAAALPGNALVQFHLAETELALGRRAEARASFARALAAAEAGSPLPQLAPRSASAWPRSMRHRRWTPAPATDAGPAIKG